VAAEIGYELEQHGELYALLDLDFLGWVGDHDTGRAAMLRNLAAIAPNYKDLGVGRYVLAYSSPIAARSTGSGTRSRSRCG
jgi:hypothetical protein